MQLVLVVFPGSVPETVTVPDLGVFPLIPALTLIVTDPELFDDVGDVEIQPTLSVDVQVQPLPVLTETEPVPPARGNAAGQAPKAYVQPLA